MVKSSETEGKERMETSSLMEQILSSDNLNRACLLYTSRELAQEYAAQIRVNEKRVAQTEGFKAKLYENRCV